MNEVDDEAERPRRRVSVTGMMAGAESRGEEDGLSKNDMKVCEDAGDNTARTKSHAKCVCVNSDVCVITPASHHTAFDTAKLGWGSGQA